MGGGGLTGSRVGGCMASGAWASSKPAGDRSWLPTSCTTSQQWRPRRPAR